MPPAADYAAAQAAVGAQLAGQSSSAFASLLDVSALAATIPGLAAAVAALVHRFGGVTALAAARYYGDVREQAGVAGKFTVPLAGPPGLDAVTQSVRWATRDLWRPDPAVPQARAAVQAVAEKLALDTGRDTVIGAVHADRQARAWARVTEPGACSFCAMLATRGAVYSRDTAGFRAHDHCRCHPEPVFGRWEAPAHVRQWEALWRESTRGLSGADARRAFRQALEGREVTAAKKAAARKAPKPGERLIAGRPESHVRAELAALEKSRAALAASGRNPAALAWQAARIAKLRAELG